MPPNGKRIALGVGTGSDGMWNTTTSACSCVSKSTHGAWWVQKRPVIAGPLATAPSSTELRSVVRPSDCNQVV